MNRSTLFGTIVMVLVAASATAQSTEIGRIQVEDAPFLAVEMSVEGSGVNQRLQFRTNVDDNVIAGAAHPIRVAIDPVTEEPSPYVLVRGALEALIARAVFYDLVELAAEDGRDGDVRFGVWSDGEFFPLGDPGEFVE